MCWSARVMEWGEAGWESAVLVVTKDGDDSRAGRTTGHRQQQQACCEYKSGSSCEQRANTCGPL